MIRLKKKNYIENRKSWHENVFLGDKTILHNAYNINNNSFPTSFKT